MITVRETIFVKMVEDVKAVRMELDIDTAAELPENDFIDGYLLWQGSIAHDISTGDFYAIDSEGTWYAQDGSGAYVPDDENNNETLNSPLSVNLRPLGINEDVLQPDVITPDTEPVNVITDDVPDINDGESIEETDTPVVFTEETESDGTGELMEEVLGNELSAITDEEDI